MHPFFFLLPPLVLLGALLFVWMAVLEPRRFRVWDVTIPRLPRDREEGLSVPSGRFPELKILHISDTHFSGRDRKKMEFLRAVLDDAGVPDFVFLTGDIMDTPPGLATCMELAAMIEARLGAFAVLGGHDFYRFGELWRKYLSIYKNEPVQSRRSKPNPVAALRNGFSEHGVVVLEDANRFVHLPEGGRIAVIGLNDTFFFHCDYEKAWRGVGCTPAIVLAHSPDVLPEVDARGAELAFFGHTHGGQIRLPLKGAIVTRSKVGACRARGVFRQGRTVFSINQGLGASRGTHIRLLCPPEVTMMRVGGKEFTQHYVTV